jgi:hypothetical protein
VYFSRGSRTHPRWEAMQERLATTFPDFSADVAEGLHDLDPGHQAEPERVGAALSAFWERAESPSSAERQIGTPGGADPIRSTDHRSPALTQRGFWSALADQSYGRRPLMTAGAA